MMYVPVRVSLLKAVIAVLEADNADGFNSNYIAELSKAINTANVDTAKLSALVSRNL